MHHGSVDMQEKQQQQQNVKLRATDNTVQISGPSTTQPQTQQATYNTHTWYITGKYRCANSCIREGVKPAPPTLALVLRSTPCSSNTRAPSAGRSTRSSQGIAPSCCDSACPCRTPLRCRWRATIAARMKAYGGGASVGGGRRVVKGHVACSRLSETVAVHTLRVLLYERAKPHPDKKKQSEVGACCTDGRVRLHTASSLLSLNTLVCT